MSCATEILRTCHTNGQARRAAFKHCASMEHFCRDGREVFHFTDGSKITVDSKGVRHGQDGN